MEPESMKLTQNFCFADSGNSLNIGCILILSSFRLFGYQFNRNKNMVRKKTRKKSTAHKKKFSKGKIGLFLFALIAVSWIAWMGLCYFRMPPTMQKNICDTVKNYLQDRQEISAYDLLCDVHRACHLQNCVRAAVPFDDCPVYGGVPVLRDYKQRENYQILKNRAFWCGYDNKKRNPIWTAYQLSAEQSFQAEEQPQLFKTDSRTRARVTSAEYIGSGFDRGQMVPRCGIAAIWGKKAEKETFLMSNVCPRKHDLNIGLWRDLELRELENYVPRYQKIWVITGPVFNHNEICETSSGVSVPTAFYKIYIDESAGRVVVMALLIPQQQTGTEKLKNFLVSVNEIESLTALDFFTEFSEEEQKKIEDVAAACLW